MTTTKTTAKKTKEASAQLSAPVYSKDGKEVRTIELPRDIFGLNRDSALIHQVSVAIDANARKPVAHTKDRSDVAGGGKKPWKQKGTGRARHGSIRSPLWRGGGTTFGPRNERDFSQKINKKTRTKALAVALSTKLKDGQLLFVDSLSFAAPKTKEARGVLDSLGGVKGFEELKTRRNNAAVISIPEESAHTKKSFGNMGNVAIVETRNLNVNDVLSHKILVVVDPEKLVERFNASTK